MKPGDYLWAPEAAPAGPLLLIVSLENQRAYVYRNGILIGISTVSTGKPGHETPTGVFSILQKRVDHKSNLYNDAPMPYMQRLTWDGIALHAGNVPGYPASHGCIRLPKAFSKLLYGLTNIGMTVIITDSAAVPRIAPMPSFLTKGADASLADVKEEVLWQPEKSADGPVSVVISTADRRAIVLRNGVLIGAAPAVVDAAVPGPVAFALTKRPDGAARWTTLPLAGQKEVREPTEAQISRLRLPEGFRKQLVKILVPGATVVVTPDTLLSGSTGNALTVIDTESMK